MRVVQNNSKRGEWFQVELCIECKDQSTFDVIGPLLQEGATANRSRKDYRCTVSVTNTDAFIGYVMWKYERVTIW